MDLSTLDTRKGSDSGFELQLLHPTTREPLDAFITVLGKDGDAYQQKSAEIKRRRLGRLARGVESAAAVDLAEAEARELLAACTNGWKGIARDGQEIAFSESAAVRLYADFEWIYEQVDAAIHNRANFLPGVSKTSSSSPDTSLS
jgi:hypothetical protein